MTDKSMSIDEFFALLQIVEFTRDQPNLRVAHDACLNKLEAGAEDFAKEISPDFIKRREMARGRSASDARAFHEAMARQQGGIAPQMPSSPVTVAPQPFVTEKGKPVPIHENGNGNNGRRI